MMLSRHALVRRRLTRLLRGDEDGTLTDARVRSVLVDVESYLQSMNDLPEDPYVTRGFARLTLRSLLLRLAQKPALSPALQGTIREIAHALPAFVEERGMRFYSDTFTGNIPRWRELLARFVGREGLRVLEIGSCEGLSTTWLLENVVTAPSARIECVDPFDFHGQPGDLPGDAEVSLEARFDRNVHAIRGADRVIKRKGRSCDVLPALEPASYDFIYVDGSHDPRDVLFDAVVSWRLLRAGGLMVFDDYGSITDSKLSPKRAVDAFLDCYGAALRVVDRGYQLTIEKAT